MLRRLTIAAALASLVCFSARAFAADKPNFILINVDDLGYADIGPYGSDNPTPHLDRMAREGRKLTSFYAAPVCSPSRAALMTGCYPKRSLPIPHVLFPASAVGLHPGEQTVADLLKAAGYATACVGKWHLGDQPEFLPTRQGFDYYYGIPYSNDMGPAEDGAKSNPGRPVPARRAANARNPQQDETGIRGFGQPPLPLLENETVIQRVRAAEQAAVTRRYTEKATEFIRQHKDEPFFLYFPHTAVHFPLYPHDEFRGKSKNGLIGDWAVEVDWSVGQILDTVRELNLDKQTLVIFTSDNGGALNHGSNNSPLRGSKGSTWEGGIRTCTIAWWPGKISAGTSTDEITGMMDVLPTFVALAGGRLPTDRKLDGKNIWPLLAGQPGAKSPHEVFYYYRGFQMQAVRSGPWKLHLARGELYHLHDDIGETDNLAAEHPGEVERLRNLADRMKDDLGLQGIGPGCRPLGRVENPQPLIAHDGTIREGFTGKPSPRNSREQ
jgi:arylsulfatase A